MNTITIHTDGSCETQTRVGGWAAILRCGEHERILQGSATDTTVNAMELMAAVGALKAIKQLGSTVEVRTDSQYVVKGITEWMPDWIARGWRTARGEAVANMALWQELQVLCSRHQVTFTWIPREQNQRADQLAQGARRNPVVEAVHEPSAKTTVHLLIAGSRYATGEALSYARRAVQRAHALGWTVVVGDHPHGVDQAVVQECRRLQTPVIVAGIGNFPRNSGCKHGSYVKVDQELYRAAGGHLLGGYTARDRWMVDTSQRGLFIWNGDSPGTKAGYDYAVLRGKPADLITFSREVVPHG